MHPLEVLALANLGNEEQKDGVEKDHDEDQDVVERLRLVHHHCEAVPLHEEAHRQEAKQDHDVTLHSQAAALEEEVSHLGWGLSLQFGLLPSSLFFLQLSLQPNVLIYLFIFLAYNLDDSRLANVQIADFIRVLMAAASDFIAVVHWTRMREFVHF